MLQLESYLELPAKSFSVLVGVQADRGERLVVA